MSIQQEAETQVTVPPCRLTGRLNRRVTIVVTEPFSVSEISSIVLRTVLFFYDMQSIDLCEILEIPAQEMTFVDAFSQHEVRYLLIGGNCHSFPRSLKNS